MFTATYERTEAKMQNGVFVGDVVLLKDLRDKADNDVIDQLWVSEPPFFRELSLRSGNRLSFSAKVMPYYTTNRDEADFRLVGLKRMSMV